MSKNYFSKIEMESKWSKETKPEKSPSQKNKTLIDLHELYDFIAQADKLIKEFKKTKTDRFMPYYFDHSAAVQALKLLDKVQDVRILKSFLLLAEQEWESGLSRKLKACAKKHISIYEDNNEHTD